jgi:hypothetical protein
VYLSTSTADVLKRRHSVHLHHRSLRIETGIILRLSGTGLCHFRVSANSGVAYIPCYVRCFSKIFEIFAFSLLCHVYMHDIMQPQCDVGSRDLCYSYRM